MIFGMWLVDQKGSPKTSKMGIVLWWRSTAVDMYIFLHSEGQDALIELASAFIVRAFASDSSS